MSASVCALFPWCLKVQIPGVLHLSRPTTALNFANSYCSQCENTDPWFRIVQCAAFPLGDSSIHRFFCWVPKIMTVLPRKPVAILILSKTAARRIPSVVSATCRLNTNSSWYKTYRWMPVDRKITGWKTSTAEHFLSLLHPDCLYWEHRLTVVTLSND